MDERNNTTDGTFNTTNRKRRYFNNAEEDGASAAKVLIEEVSFNLLSFCDEILMEIVKNLDTNSLCALGKTCRRLQGLTTDRRLWKYVDLSSEALPLNHIKSRLKLIHRQTQTISIRGLTESFPKNCWNNVSLSNSLLKDMTETCEVLQILELHHCFLDFKYMSITDFPRNLKRLVFNNCYVRWPDAPHVFFTRIDIHLNQLEELLLEYCNWFETHDLVMFSKIPHLKKLSLRGCINLKECVPYGSIATRFGFKKLEHLDVRDTLISDSDIQCFNITYTLKELLLECPDDIRELDPTNTNNTEDQATSQNSRPLQPPQPPRYQPPPISIPSRRGENNNYHIVIHDRSVINIRAPGRGNRPNIEVYIVNPAPDAMDNTNETDEEMLRRQLPDINRAISRSLWFERRYPPPFSPPHIYPISDRGILCFGAPRNAVQGNIVWIRAEPRPPNNNLERLVVRHYKLVTDTSLTHLAQCSPRLVYLDLTGTAVTRSGLEDFKLKKPECYIVSDHFTG